MNILTILIVAILMIITIIIVYTIAYIILSAIRKKDKNKQTQESVNKKKPDNSFDCKLNDIMGYDIIKIQRPDLDICRGFSDTIGQENEYNQLETNENKVSTTADTKSNNIIPIGQMNNNPDDNEEYFDDLRNTETTSWPQNLYENEEENEATSKTENYIDEDEKENYYNWLSNETDKTIEETDNETEVQSNNEDSIAEDDNEEENKLNPETKIEKQQDFQEIQNREPEVYADILEKFEQGESMKMLADIKNKTRNIVATVAESKNKQKVEEEEISEE